MRLFRGAAVLGAAACVFAVGCSGSSVDYGAGTSCKLVVRVAASAGQVTGTANAICKPPLPSEHHLDFELDYRPRGTSSWETERTAASSAVPSPTVVLTLKFSALPGAWRAYASVVGSSASAVPFSTSVGDETTVAAPSPT